jgi:hypothetical protein
MTEQLAFQGPYKAQCPCGFPSCTQFGMPMKSGHVRGCPCTKCRSGRNSRQGKAAHRKVARQLGAATQGRGSSSHEESWVFDWRVEVKSGQQAFDTVTKFKAMRQQSDATVSIGGNKPFAGIFVTRRAGDPTVVAMDLETFQRMKGDGDV